MSFINESFNSRVGKCYDLKPCVRDFRIYITRSRLRNTTLRGPTIYTCTNMCYVQGRHRQQKIITLPPLLGSHLRDVTISLSWNSNRGHFGGIWVFLVVVLTSLRCSLYNIITIFPSHLFQQLAPPFHQILQSFTSPL